MRRQSLAALLLGSTLACGVPDPADTAAGAAEVAGQLAAAAYADSLAEAAGGPISVERIAERAAAAASRIEGRMDRLAAEAGEPDGWRPLFDRLRRDAPAGEAAVLDAYRAELTRAAEFVAARDLVSLPASQPKVLALANPSLRAHFPLALYYDGSFAVTTAAADGGGAGYLANHCRACIPPLAVHEGYPGHHVAFARMTDAAGRPPSVGELARLKPFVEGWGLYAEALMLEQGYYPEPELRLAAWRMLLLRLARAEIDARLHGGGLEPAAAQEIYRARLLMTPAAAAAEVRAHLAKPTVKASYFVGLLQILALRENVMTREDRPTLRGFHDRLLGPPATIPRIARERFDVELGPPGDAELPWPWSAGEAGILSASPR